MRLYGEMEAAAMADDFDGLYGVASSAKRADFVKMLDLLEEEGHSSMALAGISCGTGG